ncbi:hydroxypyruvate isomerase family protein [Sulfitobacter sp. MF3-043]
MKCAANLSLLWPELPLLERFDAAAASGFTGVEVLFPYHIAVKDILAALARTNLEMVLINAPPLNEAEEERGFAGVPGKTARFQQDMRLVFEYAISSSVSMVHVMAGVAGGSEAKATFVENLKWAAQVAPRDLTLMIEPLNRVAMPGYFLNNYNLAQDVLVAVNAPNVALQFDSYHAQMIHGDAVAVFDQFAHLVRHVQVGDTPDRGPPGTGKVHFKALFDRMRTSGYQGWISGEYHPIGRTEDTLDWMKDL